MNDSIYDKLYNDNFFFMKKNVNFPGADYDIDKYRSITELPQMCNKIKSEPFEGDVQKNPVATLAKAPENLDSVVEHAGICAELTNIYKKKNADYGDSFSKAIKKYGLTSALVRIGDKFNRLENLVLHNKQEVKDESVQDTLLDLANYCIMTVMELRNGNN